MTAWVVRGGRLGENEHWNIAQQRVTIGWPEIGDLSNCHSREAVRALVDDADPSAKSMTRANHTGQLWAFRNSINPGDLIVMPLKSKAGYIQFGRVTGGYGYDGSQADKTRRHYLPVVWDADPVSKSGIAEDLLFTLNAIMTVFRPSRNDAAARLDEIAKSGTDPGSANDDGSAPGATGDPSNEVTDPETAPTTEAIRDRIRAHVAENFKEHRLTGLVGDILTVMGFHCEVSPPGPDGGVDILAGTGPLGLDAPTLIVEVKSEASPIDVKVVRGLHSAMVQHKAHQALLVAWGGVTKPARLEFQRDRTIFRVWDAETLLDKLFETYDRLPTVTRSQIPLKQVWVLDEGG